MDEQLYLGTRLGSCLNKCGSKLKHRMREFCSAGWSGQYHRMIRSVHQMVRWSLESITGQVSQEHVFLWLSWGSCTGWSDGYLKEYHRMIRSSTKSTARWLLESTVHRMIRWSLEKTTGRSGGYLKNHRNIRWCWIAEHRMIRWPRKQPRNNCELEVQEQIRAHLGQIRWRLNQRCA